MIERVMRERISTSAGSTSDRPGLISTSSKVSASRGLALFFAAIANSVSPEKGYQDRLPEAYKMPVARGSSRDVTARFWVGVGR